MPYLPVLSELVDLLCQFHPCPHKIQPLKSTHVTYYKSQVLILLQISAMNEWMNECFNPAKSIAASWTFSSLLTARRSLYLKSNSNTKTPRCGNRSVPKALGLLTSKGASSVILRTTATLQQTHPGGSVCTYCVFTWCMAPKVYSAWRVLVSELFHAFPQLCVRVCQCARVQMSVCACVYENHLLTLPLAVSPKIRQSKHPNRWPAVVQGKRKLLNFSYNNKIFSLWVKGSYKSSHSDSKHFAGRNITLKKMSKVMFCVLSNKSCQ